MLKSPEIGNMIADGVDATQSLAKRVETNVRQAAHGRIRNLVVEEIQGQVVVSGQAPSRHAKQLALQAALELLSSTMFSEKITIG
jgi:osmotically-inducible protein OsmY